MNFYVKKVGLGPSDVARRPNLLKISLEKRISPRRSVLNVLVFKDVNVTWILNICKNDFEKMFLAYHEEDCSEVIKAHEGVIEFQGLVK